MEISFELLLRILNYVLIGLAVGFTIRHLNKSSAKEISINECEKSRLILNKLYKILGIGGVFLWSGVILVCLNAFAEEENTGFILISIVMGFPLILSIVILLYYSNHWLEFDDKTITVSDWLDKQKSIEWSSITEVSFEPLSGYLIIRGKDVRLKISQHIVGLKTFVNEIEKKTKWTAKDIKYNL